MVGGVASPTLRGRWRRAEQRIDGGPLDVGRAGRSDLQIHPADPNELIEIQSAAEGTRSAILSIRTAAALNSAVPDFGSVASIVNRLV